MPFMLFSGLIVATLLSTAPAAAEDVEARGARFPYVAEGRGAPVIFLHGSFADLRFWGGVRETAAAEHRFIAYTRRAYGTGTWPEPPNGETGRVAQVADLVALIEAWGGPASLVGVGNSGQVALMAAAEAPDLVRAVVLFEPTLLPLLWGSSGPEGGAEIADAYDMALEDALAAEDPEAAMRQVYEFLYGLPKGGFDGLGPGFRAMALELAPHIAAEGGSPGPSLISCGALGRVQAPVLLVVAGDSRSVWALGAEAAAECLPHATIETVAGVGHDWPIADGPAFARTVLDFIDRQ